MDFIPDFSEEIWSWCAAFTNTVIVTNVFFYICLFKYWSASNLSELTDERRMKIIAGMTSYLHVVITISLVAVVWTEETSLEYRGRNDVSSTAFAVTVGYMVGDLLHHRGITKEGMGRVITRYIPYTVTWWTRTKGRNFNKTQTYVLLLSLSATLFSFLVNIIMILY